MNDLIGFLIFLCFTVALPFFMIQAMFNGRTPWSFFLSPIKNKEVKVLCSLIAKANIKQTIEVLDKVYRINNGQFTMKRHFVTDKWTLNGFQLSYLQEKRVLRAIHRRMIRTELLTDAGQVLFGGKDE